MTDDLVKFLRTSTSAAFNKAAADRIEAMTEQLEAARADAKEAEAYAEELERELEICRMAQVVMENTVADAEARLAKAVEALRKIAAEASVPVHTWKNGINFKKMYEGWRKIAAQRIDIARAVLAEIESSEARAALRQIGGEA